MIGIFNRSHYEDVLVPRVHRLAPTDRIEARYRQINAFEQHLVENDVTILKFYLHISKKEQKARLEARLQDPTKRWKFSPDDLAERNHWNDYNRHMRSLYSADGHVDAAFQIHRAHAGDHRFRTLMDNGLRENRRGGCAVAGELAGFDSDPPSASGRRCSRTDRRARSPWRPQHRLC